MELLSQSAPVGASETVIAVFLCFLTVIAFIAMIVLLCRLYKSEESANTALWLLIIFAAGLALRLIFAMCVRGYRDDYEVFTEMFAHIKTSDVSSYYKGDSGALYPVVYLVYLVFGGITNATGLSDYVLGTQFMVKLPIIIAELLTAVAVYKIAKRFVNEKVALTLCGFVCVCPVFYCASIWTSASAFTVMFICWACYFLARKKYAATIGFFTAAAYSGKEGIYVFPVICVFAVFHLVRAIINIKNDKPSGSEVFKSEYVAVISVPLSVLLSFAGAYLITLISSFAFSANPFVYIYEYLLKPLAGWKVFTLNGLSVYTVFGRNGAVPGARFPTWIFVCIFALIIIAVVCIVYFSKRNRATLVMLAAYALATMQLYYPGSTAIGFFTVFGALIAAYALVKDKRLLIILGVSSVAFIVNNMTALACSGCLNNRLAADMTTSAGALKGGLSAVPIVCSVAALLAHLYFTVVSISVGMTGIKRELYPADTVGGAFRALFAPGEGKKTVAKGKKSK